MDSQINNADIFLLSTNTETSVNQVLYLVEEIVGKKSKADHSDALAGDIRRMRYDYSKAKENLGFNPKFSTRDGISKIVEYMKQ